MIAFFDKYIKPGSPTRAKLSVHLVAQASAESDEKMTDLLKSLSLDKATETKVRASLLRPELRDDKENLQLYLKTLSLAEDKIAAVVAAAEDPATGPKKDGPSSEEKPQAGPAPTVITDIRTFRASLQATPGARPIKDLSAYEDLDAKL